MVSDTLLSRLAPRLQREAFLLVKPVWQRFGRIAGRRAPKLTIFVSGLQRSGTNMLMDAYERSLETEVFHESDPRAFDRYQQRDAAVIHRLVDRSPAPVVVLKALLEGHKVRQLLDEFAPARAVWMFRHYDDMINSNMANWPGGRNRIDDIVRDRNAGDWRGLGMTDETHAILKRHYRPDMDDASALALFYYYRHQLFYDQGLDRDPRVYLLSYEDLVSAPARLIEEVAAFSGLRPTPRMSAHIHARSVRRQAGPEMAADTRALAARMYEALRATRAAKHGPSMAA